MSAFTPRENAADAFTLARATAAVPAMGAREWQGDSTAKARGRRADRFRIAEARIISALKSERRFSLEPTDEQLTKMLESARAEIARLNEGL